MAPQVGLEPTTLRLTAGCSAIELLRSERKTAGLTGFQDIMHRRRVQLEGSPDWRLPESPTLPKSPTLKKQQDLTAGSRAKPRVRGDCQNRRNSRNRRNCPKWLNSSAK